MGRKNLHTYISNNVLFFFFFLKYSPLDLREFHLGKLKKIIEVKAHLGQLI